MRRPTANLNETALDLSAGQIRSPKSDYNLAMAPRRAAFLSGNASLIATFSCLIFSLVFFMDFDF